MNINEFQGSINKRGVLQNNRFVVNFALPPALRGNETRYGFNDRLVYLRCESAQIPGVNLATVDMPRIGIGPIESMPHNVTFDDAVALTFLNDAHSAIHALFFDWFNTIINFQGSRGQSTLDKKYTIANQSIGRAYEVGYKENYKTTVIISVYTSSANEDGVKSQSETGVESMRVVLYNAFPKTLPSVDLSWASNDELVRMTIPFNFTDFRVYHPRAGKTFAPRMNTGFEPAQAPEATGYIDPEYSPYAIFPDTDYL